MIPNYTIKSFEVLTKKDEEMINFEAIEELW